MERSGSSRRKGWIVVLASAISLYALAGQFGESEGYTDALFWHDYTLPDVPPGGPLEEAGFLPGDSVVSVEGIPVEELGMYSRWPRSLARKPGETLTMTVERGGERVSGEIRYRERPSGVRRMQLGGLFVVLTFLWAGVWAFLFIPSSHAARLAAMGFALGLAVPGPNLGGWNGVRDHIQLAGMVLFTLLLLRFFLSFPEPKRIARGHLSTVLFYLPWLFLLGCLGVELAFHPRFYHAFGGFSSLLMLAYAALAVVALLHAWFSSSREERSASGMSRVLAGVGVGLGGLLLWVVDAALLPAVEVPLSSWLPLLLVAIPIGMVLGVRHGAAAG
ncbi:MAG: PDZ domain-containing protein, partial [Gemmatimonadota bacterium]